LDGASGNGTPKEGDISICAYCESFAFYNKDLTLRPATLKETEDLLKEDEVKEIMLAVRNVWGKSLH